jgi:hypothetical protein
LLSSWDDLIGAQQERLGNREIQGPGRLEIHDELELRWLLHGHLCRFLAPQDAIDVVGAALEDGDEIRPVRQEGTALGIASRSDRGEA